MLVVVVVAFLDVLARGGSLGAGTLGRLVRVFLLLSLERRLGGAALALLLGALRQALLVYGAVTVPVHRLAIVAWLLWRVTTATAASVAAARRQRLARIVGGETAAGSARLEVRRLVLRDHCGNGLQGPFRVALGVDIANLVADVRVERRAELAGSCDILLREKRPLENGVVGLHFVPSVEFLAPRVLGCHRSLPRTSLDQHGDLQRSGIVGDGTDFRAFLEEDRDELQPTVLAPLKIISALVAHGDGGYD